MKAINIKWDIDDLETDEIEDLDLPEEVDIPDYMIDEDGEYDEDEISDYLSDLTGFCHCSFTLIDDDNNEV